MVDFVGRHAELNVLRAGLADARAGRPRVVLIEGAAGIGKTALLDQFVAGCADDPEVVVLRASGDEDEQLLAYGVLRQLERAAARQGFSGPRGKVDGAHHVPGLTQASPDDRRLVDPVTAGTEVLEFLDAMSASVVLLVVDDVPWSDRHSLQALVFALRRLVADRVLAVFAARENGIDALPESLAKLVHGQLGTVIRLAGLGEQELHELAQALGVAGVGATAARRLQAGTDGNPLYARAILEEFPVSSWVNGQDELLPSPRSFRTVVRERYAGCAPASRRLIDAVAVLGQRAPVADAVALAGLGDPVAAIDEAVAHELLRVSPGEPPWSVEFTHPLVRAAVYDTLGPADRHTLHLRAVERSPDEAARLRHRVAAATGPDEALATDLTAFAEQAQRRFDWKSAATHLVSASRLSVDPEVARRRVLWALVWTLLRGDAAAAEDFADEVAGYPPGPLRDLVLASLAMAAEDPSRAGQLLDRAWRSRDSADPEAAAIALLQAIHHYGRLDASRTVSWSEQALAALDDQREATPGTSIYPAVVTYLVHGLGYAGRVGESRAAAEAADRDPDESLHVWLNPRSARGVLHLIDDEYDSATAVLESVADAASRLGILNTSAFSLAYLARTEWMSGRWDDAQLHADRAVAINLESDFGFLRSAVVGIAVLVPAARGDWAAAQEYLRLLPRTQVHYERSIVALGMARARLGEARGRPLEVLAALDQIRLFPERDAADEPGFWAWPDLYSDALVQVGRAEEADRFLVRHEQLAAARGRTTPQARLARARSRVEVALGRPNAARAALDRALELVGTVHAPFERARIELAGGQVLRQIGQRRRAVELLLAGRDSFGALGAAPYLARCDAELAAAGLPTAARPGRLRFGLTAQELVVARLAASGLSNREIAAELVVSIKTVEYHLRNAFAKLGVTSRHQLGEWLGSLP